ncbi:hypothetical protein H5410_015104 [Solanum commersonii]|uniref:Uncharacterized protein n=1 Tax=Solanum commersonii TaxID=4109 RepID=A0A9J5ZSX0_SOLCO|nr:hypothetical protein H5410_015104 [Solanum commersonii]
MEDLLLLSRGPLPYVIRFKGHIVTGYRFHVDMNPQKLKYEMRQASKIPKHKLIHWCLSKGTRSKFESYEHYKTSDNSFHVNPCFDEKEDNGPFRQGAEMNEYTLTRLEDKA